MLQAPANKCLYACFSVRGFLVQKRRKLHPLLRIFQVCDAILKHHLFMVFIMCDFISETELDPR